jgi:hypothetical protein
MQPDFVCTINNTTYRYKAGTTQEVPDEVAELIANIDAQEPVENPPETLEHEIARIATQIAEAKIAEAMTPFIVTLTMTSETAATADKTTGEIVAEINKGRPVIAHIANPNGYTDTLVTSVVAGNETTNVGLSLRAITTLDMSGVGEVFVEAYANFSDGESGTTWGISIFVLTPLEA